MTTKEMLELLAVAFPMVGLGIVYMVTFALFSRAIERTVRESVAQTLRESTLPPQTPSPAPTEATPSPEPALPRR